MNEDYWRIILGMITLVIFMIVSIFGVAGLAAIQKEQPKALPYDDWWMFFQILPIFIIGISLYIMGLTNWIRSYRNRKLQNRHGVE